MKTEESKKQEELTDEQLDYVAGGGFAGKAGAAGKAGKMQKSYKVDVELFLNITIMKTEDNKKQEELTDEQLDKVAGGGAAGKAGKVSKKVIK